MQREEAEFANEAFYLAFAEKDIQAMDNIWAKSAPVLCLHPGWPLLSGRDDVMESWRSILSNPSQQPIDFYGVQSSALNSSTVAVVCYELVGGSAMVATNVFVQEDGQPRIALHQAGFCGNPPPNQPLNRG
ncbi:MAG: nuclear transport factor 2 family protein [Proteobacteria bacterium]|nr:nuclear transport factor 2 family protein [Pseudomonadota bacterium]